MKKLVVSRMIIVALTITVVAIFGGCNVCRKGVYMNSLMEPMSLEYNDVNGVILVPLNETLQENNPIVLTIHHDTLTVIMGRSVNSAFLISKLKISVKHSQQKIYLSAYEAMAIKCCKPWTNRKNSFRPLTSDNSFTNTFHIKLSKYKVSDLFSYEYFYQDPNNKTTKLEITPYYIQTDN